jgi:hypothetical protein
LNSLSQEQLHELSTLANGIIPPDARDGGAGEVQAGARIAERIAAGINSELYLKGLEIAEAVAKQKFGKSVRELDSSEIEVLLGLVRENSPGFFKQLRMDVSGLYLSDPEVWKRIGFPGPSSELGGHPDFDQSQELSGPRELVP